MVTVTDPGRSNLLSLTDGCLDHPNSIAVPCRHRSRVRAVLQVDTRWDVTAADSHGRGQQAPCLYVGGAQAKEQMALSDGAAVSQVSQMVAQLALRPRRADRRRMGAGTATREASRLEGTMTTYHAKRLTNSIYGDGYYIIRRERGIDSVMPRYFSGDFPESRFEAETLAHNLNHRQYRAGEAYVPDRARRRVNE